VSDGERIALEPHVYDAGPEVGHGRLLGARCQRCQRRFFPYREFCAICALPTTESIELAPVGVLNSFARVDRKPPHCLIEPPYVIGEVLIDDDLAIYSLVVGAPDRALRRGEAVRLTEIVVTTPAGERVAYAFRPAESGRA
jgi:uncharacterized OB-fold protein